MKRLVNGSVQHRSTGACSRRCDWITGIFSLPMYSCALLPRRWNTFRRQAVLRFCFLVSRVQVSVCASALLVHCASLNRPTEWVCCCFKCTNDWVQYTVTSHLITYLAMVQINHSVETAEENARFHPTRLHTNVMCYGLRRPRHTSANYYYCCRSLLCVFIRFKTYFLRSATVWSLLCVCNFFAVIIICTASQRVYDDDNEDGDVEEENIHFVLSFVIHLSHSLSRFIHDSISHLCARRVPHRLTYNSDETTYFIISHILSLSRPRFPLPGHPHTTLYTCVSDQLKFIASAPASTSIPSVHRDAARQWCALNVRMHRAMCKRHSWANGAHLAWEIVLFVTERMPTISNNNSESTNEAWKKRPRRFITTIYNRKMRERE